jgi:hypothetical protein
MTISVFRTDRTQLMLARVVSQPKTESLRVDFEPAGVRREHRSATSTA